MRINQTPTTHSEVVADVDADLDRRADITGLRRMLGMLADVLCCDVIYTNPNPNPNPNPNLNPNPNPR
jgi:hypothetical protein